MAASAILGIVLGLLSRIMLDARREGCMCCVVAGVLTGIFTCICFWSIAAPVAQILL